MYGRYSRKKRFSKTKKRTKRYYKRGYKPNLQKQVRYLLKQNKVNRPELKNYDGIISIHPTTTVSVTELSNMHDGYSTNKSLQLKWNVTANGTARTWTKMVLVLDRKPDEGVPLTWSDIYKYDPAADGFKGINSVRTIVEDDNQKRFKVMYEKNITNIWDTDGTDERFKIGKWFKKLNMPSLVDQAETPTGQKNVLYLMIASTATVNTELDMDIQWRLRYVPKAH